MDTIPRRSALAAGATLVLTGCVGSGDEAIPAVGDDTATIAAWIEQRRGSLPTDYDELGRLPFPYRREIVQRLSSVEQSALKQEHLRQAIASRPWLTAEQRAVIDLAREAMTPAWFEATPEERQRWGTRWGQRIGEAFDQPEFIRIFGSIGPEDDAIRQMITDAMTPPSREAIEEAIRTRPRPVFVPLERDPFSGGDPAVINARLLELHEGAAWAWDHRDNLPTGYDELDRLPLNIREAVIEALPIVTAVGLVLERIQRSADADREMTDAQRAVLAEAPRYVTAEWAEASTDDREAMYPDGGWWQRAKEVFVSEEWRRIFGESDAIGLWGRGRFLSLGDCARAVGW